RSASAFAFSNPKPYWPTGAPGGDLGWAFCCRTPSARVVLLTAKLGDVSSVAPVSICDGPNHTMIYWNCQTLGDGIFPDLEGHDLPGFTGVRADVDKIGDESDSRQTSTVRLTSAKATRREMPCHRDGHSDAFARSANQCPPKFPAGFAAS